MKIKKPDMARKIARLESLNDQLEAELVYMDRLMKEVGFSKGINTIKATAREIIEHGYEAS